MGLFVVCVRGQLDLELTLRDQRMVSDLSHVPRRTKLALRCHTLHIFRNVMSLLYCLRI